MKQETKIFMCRGVLTSLHWRDNGESWATFQTKDNRGNFGVNLPLMEIPHKNSPQETFKTVLDGLNKKGIEYTML